MEVITGGLISRSRRNFTSFLKKILNIRVRVVLGAFYPFDCIKVQYSSLSTKVFRSLADVLPSIALASNNKILNSENNKFMINLRPFTCKFLCMGSSTSDYYFKRFALLHDVIS